jgi:hypothetical protein
MKFKFLFIICVSLFSSVINSNEIEFDGKLVAMYNIKNNDIKSYRLFTNQNSRTIIKNANVFQGFGKSVVGMTAVATSLGSYIFSDRSIILVRSGFLQTYRFKKPAHVLVSSNGKHIFGFYYKQDGSSNPLRSYNIDKGNSEEVVWFRLDVNDNGFVSEQNLDSALFALHPHDIILQPLIIQRYESDYIVYPTVSNKFPTRLLMTIITSRSALGLENAANSLYRRTISLTLPETLWNIEGLQTFVYENKVGIYFWSKKYRTILSFYITSSSLDKPGLVSFLPNLKVKLDDSEYFDTVSFKVYTTRAYVVLKKYALFGDLVYRNSDITIIYILNLESEKLSWELHESDRVVLGCVNDKDFKDRTLDGSNLKCV